MGVSWEHMGMEVPPEKVGVHETVCVAVHHKVVDCVQITVLSKWHGHEVLSQTDLNGGIICLFLFHALSASIFSPSGSDSSKWSTVYWMYRAR